MRITGGTLRGRVVRTRVSAGVRPTSSRVREALFNVLGHDLAGRSALDAFGGAGLLALEAWSRGASPVTIVERDRSAAKAIRLAAQELGARLDLVEGDAARVLAKTGSWDLVFLDPPYREEPGVWLSRAAPRTRWRLVIEHSVRASLPSEVPGFVLLRHKRYGDTGLGVYGPAPTTAAPGDVVAQDGGVVEGKG